MSKFARIATLPISLGLALSLGVGVVSATSTTAANLTEVTAAINAALALKSVPHGLRPTIAALAVANSSSMLQSIGVHFGDACNPNQHPEQLSVPVPCEFGNPAAVKTIVIFGDSNVGNWLPAFSKGLAASQYKVSVYFFPGCPTADLAYTLLTSALKATQCNAWHSSTETAIALEHPAAIVAVQSLAMSWRLSTSAWIPGMTKFFNNATVGNASVKRVILGTSPFWQVSTPTCLSRASSPSVCATTSPTYQAALTGRDPQVAAATRAKLLPTFQWFCKTSKICPPILAGNIVSGDQDHTTIAASTYLATVASQALLAAVR